jgi:hypothetical protein
MDVGDSRDLGQRHDVPPPAIPPVQWRLASRLVLGPTLVRNTSCRPSMANQTGVSTGVPSPRNDRSRA